MTRPDRARDLGLMHDSDIGSSLYHKVLGLAEPVNVCVTGSNRVAKEYCLRRLVGRMPCLRRDVFDVKAADRQELVMHLRSLLGASCIDGEKRAVLLWLADTVAPCPTLAACIKNLMEAYRNTTVFFICVPTLAFASLFNGFCVHVHLAGVPRRGHDVLRECLREVVETQCDTTFMRRAREFVLHAAGSCLTVPDLCRSLLELWPCAEVAQIAAECDQAWKASNDFCVCAQAVITLARNHCKVATYSLRPGSTPDSSAAP